MRIKRVLFCMSALLMMLSAHDARAARILRVGRDNVDAFKEPTVNSYVVDTLNKNELYEIIDKKSGWYKLKLYGNQQGWVQSEDVAVKGEKIATPDPTKTILELDTLYEDSYAVIIAIDEYADFDNLRYALNDAELLKRELQAIGFKNFFELYNKAATLAAITDLFERKLLKRVKEDDRVFVFFAGKSYSKEIAPDVFEGYIMPYDTSKNFPEQTSISTDIIDTFVAKLEAIHVLVVYDTCLSGLSLKKAVSIPQSRPGYLLNVLSKEGRQVITAGKHKNEMVLREGSSIFIQTLIEGINGSAEHGLPDGIVTGSELSSYLKLKVSVKTQRRQTPDFGRMQGGDKGGELIFTRRKGSIFVTQEIKLGREDALGSSSEEEFLMMAYGEDEGAAGSGRFSEEEGIDAEEVAGPLPLFPGELVVVPAGDVHIGSTEGHINERPVHVVYLNSYYIGRYEVTNREYKEFIDSTGYPAPLNVEGLVSEYNTWKGRNYYPGMDNKPVVNVSWYDAVAYCKWLSSVTGENYRLPTESEWEKAARGVDQRVYPWGNTRPSRQKSNYKKAWAGPFVISDVGFYDKGKSPYWIYEMAGNVWEWCSDWYSENAYDEHPRSNPQGPLLFWSSKVVRGGSWASNDDMLRSTARYGYYPKLRSSRGGFRIVLQPER